MNLKDILKSKFLPWVAGGVLALGLVFTSYKACDLYDDSAVWKGKYEQQVEVNNDQLKALKELRDYSNVLQANLDRAIQGHQQAMEDKDAEIDSKDVKIADLQKIIDTEVATPGKVIEISGQKYIHMHIFELKQAQFEEAVAQRDLAKEQLQLQKNITLEWQKKYAYERQLRLATETSLSDEVKLRLIGEKRIKSLEWDLKKKNFLGFVKDGVIVVLLAGVTYSLVK